jgi:ribonuclease P protein 3
VYIKTNPEELERFKKFVEKTAPYDCVIDGLNVAYSMGTNKSPGVYARILTMVVKHFVDDGKRVLVLGRKHMMKWPRDQMTYINKNSLVFLTENM